MRNFPNIRPLLLPTGYALLIFVTLPVLPCLWKYMEAGNPRLAIALPAIIMVCICYFLLFWLLALKDDTCFWKYILFVLLCLGVFCVVSGMRLPIEKIHIVEYACLTVFIVRGFHKKSKVWWTYPVACLFSMLIGVLDEGVQYFLPNRVFDTYDIVANWKGAFFGLAASIILYYSWPDKAGSTLQC